MMTRSDHAVDTGIIVKSCPWLKQAGRCPLWMEYQPSFLTILQSKRARKKSYTPLQFVGNPISKRHRWEGQGFCYQRSLQWLWPWRHFPRLLFYDRASIQRNSCFHPQKIPADKNPWRMSACWTKHWNITLVGSRLDHWPNTPPDTLIPELWNWKRRRKSV